MRERATTGETKRLALIAAVLFGVALPVPVLADAAIPPDVIETATRYAAQAHVTLDNSLSDYPSARFRNVRATYSPRLPGGKNWLTFCGEVNAKNKMGGYIGWTPFALVPGDTPMLLMSNDGIGQESVPRMCASGNENWLSADFTEAFSPPK